MAVVRLFIAKVLMRVWVIHCAMCVCVLYTKIHVCLGRRASCVLDFAYVMTCIVIGDRNIPSTLGRMAFRFRLIDL